MLNAVNQGRCTLEHVVSWMCEAPARVWSIHNKGRIAAGYDADLVLIDLNKRHTVQNDRQLTRCGWSPWHGETLTGQAVHTWVMGQTVFANGEVDRSIRGREAKFRQA